MIAKGKYVRGGGAAAQKKAASHLKAHFKYIEHRSQEENSVREERAIFSKERDQVDRKEATREILEHSSNSVCYHKIMLSPGEDEPVQDWRQWTRDVMADLEETRGKQLHWYAVHHSNTEHGHVHIVVAGKGENEETGREEVVKLYTQDYQQLRDSGHIHSEYNFYHALEEWAKELNGLDEIGKEYKQRELSTLHDFDREGGFDR